MLKTKQIYLLYQLSSQNNIHCGFYLGSFFCKTPLMTTNDLLLYK